jgi:hypothetical protein
MTAKHLIPLYNLLSDDEKEKFVKLMSYTPKQTNLKPTRVQTVKDFEYLILNSHGKTTNRS